MCSIESGCRTGHPVLIAGADWHYNECGSATEAGPQNCFGAGMVVGDANFCLSKVPKDTYFYFSGKFFVDDLQIIFMKNCNEEVLLVDFF